VLTRARRARIIRSQVSADDLRHLISALGAALEATPDGLTKVDLYVDVLMQGLRPKSPRPTAKP
jgi:hypothetical protein